MWAKTGMCPVPTLFSVFMNDLVSMLSEQNLASDIINCLLFVDDIVLMGKSEQELQTLLNITARFASKRNLKFNSIKLKVMVIGQKIDKLKRWDLGNELIEETNVYKYLRVYFSRSLKFIYHIETFHKGKCPEKTKLYDTNFGRTR
jgi:hypothetical protein